MPSLRSESPENPGIDWLGIVRTLLVQVFVLLALSGAFIGYIRWSSDKAWAEFNDAIKTSAPAPKLHQHSAAPVETVKGHALCTRRA